MTRPRVFHDQSTQLRLHAISSRKQADSREMDRTCRTLLTAPVATEAAEEAAEAAGGDLRAVTSNRMVSKVISEEAGSNSSVHSSSRTSPLRPRRRHSMLTRHTEVEREAMYRDETLLDDLLSRRLGAGRTMTGMSRWRAGVPCGLWAV